MRIQALLEQPVWLWCCLLVRVLIRSLSSTSLLPLHFSQPCGSPFSFISPLNLLKCKICSNPSSPLPPIKSTTHISLLLLLYLGWKEKTVTLSAAGMRGFLNKWWMWHHHNLSFNKFLQDEGRTTEISEIWSQILFIKVCWWQTFLYF